MLWVLSASAEQHIFIQVAGSDQPIRAEWVGEESLELRSGRDAWEGAFLREEPRRFLPLRLWQGRQMLWEGTVPLADQHAESLAFRLVDRGSGRQLERVASVAPLPVVGSAGPQAAVAWLWGAFLLIYLGFLLRRKGV